MVNSRGVKSSSFARLFAAGDRDGEINSQTRICGNLTCSETTKRDPLKARFSVRRLVRVVRAERENLPKRPSPARALLGWTYHVLSFIFASSSRSVTCCGLSASGKSCLLANTSRRQSFISRSERILCSSSFASPIRSTSVLSITKTRPCVPV